MFSIDRREASLRSDQYRSAGLLLIGALSISSVATSTATANPLAPIWTGAYIGLNGGVAMADVNTEIGTIPDASRAGFGGYVGYNLGLGRWMIGIEFDASHVGSSDSLAITGGGTVTLETDWQGSLRARLGMSVGPARLYATAGWAWADAAFLESRPAGSSPKVDETVQGVVYGLGAEAFVLPSISLKIEALRFDYGTAELSAGGGFQAMREIEMQDTVIRAGITIHYR